MIHIEEVKLKLDGLDSLDLIREYSKLGFDKIQADHFSLMRWYGAYQQKPNNGHFMLRIKIGGGQLSAAQLLEISNLSRDYGRGLGDITTRQNIQLHWVTIEDLPQAIERLQAAGLTTTGACGDVTRNVVGCPVAGIDAGEVIDATPVLKAVEGRLLGNRNYSNLPRKFKISVSGCHIGCAQPLINDIGLVAVARKGNPQEVRYALYVGGGLSTTPKFARPLGVLLESGELPDVCEQIAGIFRDYGNRENRKRARMKFLVEDWGAEKFRCEVEARLGRQLAPWSDEFNRPCLLDDDHAGIHAQKEEGLVYVGVPVKTGRFSAHQMRRMAEASTEYGQGRIRLTNHQNLLLLDIPRDAVDRLCADLSEVGLNVRSSETRRLLVACTGSEFCNLALTETKECGARIVDRLEQVIPSDGGLRIHLSGCPNSCGQFQTGDIGLTGVTFQKKGETEKTEAYNIFAGGGYGDSPAFGRRLALKVPKEDLPELLATVYRNFTSRRKDGESFQAYCARISDADVIALGKNGD
jgi:sulfite reductase beta subunit-like hemoprotein